MNVSILPTVPPTRITSGVVSKLLLLIIIQIFTKSTSSRRPLLSIRVTQTKVSS